MLKTMKLTARQTALLAYMCRDEFDQQFGEWGGEMVVAIRKNLSGVFTSAEQGQTVASQLVAKGLARKLGVTSTGAQCFGPTDAGREHVTG